MKRLPLLLILAALLFGPAFAISNPPVSTNPTSGSTDGQKFIQFYATGLETVDDQARLNEYMRAKEEVMMCRAHSGTRTVFVILNQGYDIRQDQLASELRTLGFKVNCYREGIHGVDRVYNTSENFCD